jgi:hypothetical protein
MSQRNEQSQLPTENPRGESDDGEHVRERSIESDTTTPRLQDHNLRGALGDASSRVPLDLDPSRKAVLLSVLFVDPSDDTDGAA